jgi:phosphate:Na+ symporter
LFNESTRLLENSAYKAIAHGINVHRTDIDSDKKIGEIIDQKEVIDVDFDQIYYRQIKSIYNEIVEFGTMLQSNFTLKKRKIELIRNILIANRHMVEIVKDMKRLHRNLSKYFNADNYFIKSEYNDLRKMLLKVIREIREISDTKEPDKHLKKLEKLKNKADKSDVLVDGSIQKLVKGNKITNEMATSLVNDSALVTKMCHKLANIAELLYIQSDTILEEETLDSEALDKEEGILTAEESHAI